MRIPDLDRVLSAMLKTYDGISDLNFSVGHPLQVEDYGELKPVFVDPPIDALTPFQTEQIALTLIQGNRRLIYDYLTGGSCDCSYSLGHEARFRVNIFRQQGHFSIVLRKLEGEIPSVKSLGLPSIFEEIAKEKTGLVLVTGATGSGKTTSLAAILNEVNENQPVHVITLEDPIEFVHPKLKATFNQRELGHDFNNYPNGLRAALRQAPKIILVGEMRDRATVEVALMAAETGHLVLSTLHTVDAGQAINRILGLFSLGEEKQLRIRLADSLRYVIRKRLPLKLMDQEDPNFIDLGDNTALVCVDHQQYQKIVVPQLIDMAYKVHLGLFEEDVALKLNSYDYDVVVIYENFKNSKLETN